MGVCTSARSFGNNPEHLPNEEEIAALDYLADQRTTVKTFSFFFLWVSLGCVHKL